MMMWRSHCGVQLRKITMLGNIYKFHPILRKRCVVKYAIGISYLKICFLKLFFSTCKGHQTLFDKL